MPGQRFSRLRSIGEVGRELDRVRVGLEFTVIFWPHTALVGDGGIEDREERHPAGPVSPVGIFAQLVPGSDRRRELVIGFPIVGAVVKALDAVTFISFFLVIFILQFSLSFIYEISGIIYLIFLVLL